MSLQDHHSCTGCNELGRSEVPFCLLLTPGRGTGTGCSLWGLLWGALRTGQYVTSPGLQALTVGVWQDPGQMQPRHAPPAPSAQSPLPPGSAWGADGRWTEGPSVPAGGGTLPAPAAQPAAEATSQPASSGMRNVPAPSRDTETDTQHKRLPGPVSPEPEGSGRGILGPPFPGPCLSPPPPNPNLPPTPSKYPAPNYFFPTGPSSATSIPKLGISDTVP